MGPSKPKPGTAAAHNTEETAFLNDDIALDTPAMLAGPPAAASSYFEASDADGNTYWQEMPVATKPKKLPLRPVFPPTAPPRTPREGRLASPIGWGGTPNLTDAQAKALRKE